MVRTDKLTVSLTAKAFHISIPANLLSAVAALKYILETVT